MSPTPTLANPRPICFKPGLKPPGQSGLPWRFFAHSDANGTGPQGLARNDDPEDASSRRASEENQMPKLKTKSGAKKRFKVTGTGKVVYTQAGKRHGMIKRTKKQIRNHRGTNILFKSDGDNIKRFFLPNG